MSDKHKPDIARPRTGEEIWQDIFNDWKVIDNARKSNDPNIDIKGRERSLISQIAAWAVVWEAWHTTQK
jgi:hypothetical protein